MLNLCHKGLGAGERKKTGANPIDVDYLIAWYDLPSAVVWAGILELKLAVSEHVFIVIAYHANLNFVGFK